MTLVAKSGSHDQVSKTITGRYRSQAELDIRDAVELWARAKWPTGRVVHELVMDRGNVRADIAVVDPAHLVAIEIKSGFDNTTRLMHQVAMFQLATPELWIVTERSHRSDVAMIRYLLPTIGVAEVERVMTERSGPFQLKELHQPAPFTPHPDALLSLLWVAELSKEAICRGFGAPGKMTHQRLVQSLGRLSPEDRLRSVCRQLRARDALWRADPPIRPEQLPGDWCKPSPLVAETAA